MTNWATWFRQQLQSSADGFVWAFEQIAPALHDKLPRIHVSSIKYQALQSTIDKLRCY
ncbi:MAG: hypothetical protein M3R61_03450 [Chloroflexota bacterium]|nr:hypothetical protein [Chloroflexota bacterium]